MDITELTEKMAANLVALPQTNLAIGLCTTSTSGGKQLNYFSFPRRGSNGLIYFHLVLKTTGDALRIVSDRRFANASLFVDIEQKNRAFDGWNILAHIAASRRHVIEPNALTVNALMSCILTSETRQSVGVIGTGNIARSLCARLDQVNLYYRWIFSLDRPSSKRMTELFPAGLLNESKDGPFDIVVNTVPMIGVADFHSLIHKNTLFIEAAGLTSSDVSSLDCKKMQLDTRDHQLNYVHNILVGKDQLSAFGCRQVSGYNVCSGGYIGNKGDLVVDDCNKPSHVIGVADGKGGFLERHMILFNEYIEAQAGLK